MNEPPKGYHREWLVDDDWKIGGDGRHCRFPRCSNPAVAALKRRHRGALSIRGFRWWYYCAEHMYDRKIEDGVVKVHCLVEDERPA